MNIKQSVPTTVHNPHQPTAVEKLVAFLDERMGLKEMQAKMLNEPIPRLVGPTCSGLCCCSSSLCRALTGMLLMFYYVPTADHAYDSTQYIIHEVDYGWFLLSYHFWGSSAMVVCVFAHMSRVLWGLQNRENCYGLSVLPCLASITFGFTGYLCPGINGRSGRR